MKLTPFNSEHNIEIKQNQIEKLKDNYKKMGVLEGRNIKEVKIDFKSDSFISMVKELLAAFGWLNTKVKVEEMINGKTVVREIDYQDFIEEFYQKIQEKMKNGELIIQSNSDFVDPKNEKLDEDHTLKDNLRFKTENNLRSINSLRKSFNQIKSLRELNSKELNDQDKKNLDALIKHVDIANIVEILEGVKKNDKEKFMNTLLIIGHELRMHDDDVMGKEFKDVLLHAKESFDRSGSANHIEGVFDPKSMAYTLNLSDRQVVIPIRL